MPDTPKKPEQSSDEQSPEKINDLPDRAIDERDAQSVKGGLGNVKYSLPTKG